MSKTYYLEENEGKATLILNDKNSKGLYNNGI